MDVFDGVEHPRRTRGRQEETKMARLMADFFSMRVAFTLPLEDQLQRNLVEDKLIDLEPVQNELGAR